MTLRELLYISILPAAWIISIAAGLICQSADISIPLYLGIIIGALLARLADFIAARDLERRDPNLADFIKTITWEDGQLIRMEVLKSDESIKEGRGGAPDPYDNTQTGGVPESEVRPDNPDRDAPP